MQQEKKALLLLLIVTLFWGLTFPIIKNALNEVGPATFVTLRFALAGLVLLPLVVRDLRHGSLSALKAGIILGLLNGITYLAPIIGLQSISAAQAAFIVGTTVVFVPFMLPLFKLGKVHKVDILAVFICLLGLFIFTGFAMQLKLGSIWCLLSAISCAFGIVFLQFVTQNEKVSFLWLAFYQILFTLPVPLLMVQRESGNHVFAPAVMLAVLFCAIFATSLAFFLQTKYQRFVNATKATLIYSLEPVFATLFAWLIHQESITFSMVIGGIIMLSGTFLHIVTRK